MWRLTDESGQSSSYVRADDDPLVIINLSVWESPDHLHDFVFHTAHTPFLRRRREWFERMPEAFLVCWWVPAGEVPTVEASLARLERLRQHGVSDEAFTLRDRRPPPATAVPRANRIVSRRRGEADGPEPTGADSVVGRMERFGLVGLPNAGKSSLYNALTGGGALAAPYAFATKDPNIGVAKVPDVRLDRLAEMSKSRNVVHAAVQVVDIGGLVEGASKGEGLGNKFLANIREVDAVVFVLRAFEDDDITGPSDPLEHLRVVELELALADLETVEKRLHQAQRQSKLDRSLGDEVAALQAAYDALSEGRPLYRAGLNAGAARRPGAALPAHQPARSWPSSTSARTTSTPSPPPRPASPPSSTTPATTSR